MNARNRIKATLFSLALLTGTFAVPKFAANAQGTTQIEPPKTTQLLAQATQAQATFVALYRYYNATTGDHFYTANFNELGNGGSGYVSEGIAARIYNRMRTGTVPLYRYFNATISDHFYTTNLNELGSTGSNGYVYEGITGYIYPTATIRTVPLYRYYNATTGDHFYTINRNELGVNGRDGYVAEGIAGYVFRPRSSS